jgi:hypothetical protein
MIRRSDQHEVRWEYHEIWRAWHTWYQAYIRFILFCFDEAERRGLDFNTNDRTSVGRSKRGKRWKKPLWVGWDAMHSTHRKNLLYMGICELIAERIGLLRNNKPVSAHDPCVEEWLSRVGMPGIYGFDNYHVTEVSEILDREGAPYPERENHYKQFEWAEEADGEICHTPPNPESYLLC